MSAVASALQQYGYNLTQLARQSVFSPLMEHDAVVERILHILLQQAEDRAKRNPFLLDSDETCRSKIVFEVVRRMASGKSFEALSRRQVIALNYETLFAGLSTPWQRLWPNKGTLAREIADQGTDPESEEILLERLMTTNFWLSLEEWNAPNEVLARLQAFFLEVCNAEGEILLFINDFHRLLVNSPQEYSVDASGLLKPVLARHEIQLIAACSPAQYEQYIERDAAISRRFQEVRNNEV